MTLMQYDTTTTTTKQGKTSRDAEVILTAWEVQAQDESGEWTTVAHEDTKRSAIAASVAYLANGCAVRIVHVTAA